MHSTFSIEELDSILSLGKHKLLKMVPDEFNRHSGAYKEVLEKNYNWYLILTALAECCTNSKKRANKFGWQYNLSLRYMAELWIDQQGRCSVTGIIMSPKSGYLDDKNPYKISTDRIINSGGYVKGNVRLLTHWANNAKSTWSESVFKDFVVSSNSVLTESVA